MLDVPVENVAPQLEHVRKVPVQTRGGQEDALKHRTKDRLSSRFSLKVSGHLSLQTDVWRWVDTNVHPQHGQREETYFLSRPARTRPARRSRR